MKNQMFAFVASAAAALAVACGLVFFPSACAAADFVMPGIPVIEPGPVVSLDFAVSSADSSNRSLAVLREDLAVAKEKLRASWAGLVPKLYGNAAYSLSEKTSGVQVGGQTVGGSDMNRVTAGLTLSVPLISAEQWMSVDSAGADSELTTAQVEQSRQVLLYSVAEAWFQAATALSLTDVYKSQYESAAEHLRLAEGRLSAGVGSIIDVKSAQAEVVSAWTDIVKAGYALEDARDALGVLMGTGGLPVPDMASVGKVADSDSLRGRVEDRWDLRSAEAALKLRRTELKAGYMQFVPTLSGAFQYSANLLESSSSAADRDSWSLGLNLSVPLFDQTFYPALRLKKAAIRQTELQVEEIRIEAERSVRGAERSVERLRKLVDAAAMKASVADDLLSYAEADYANGTGLAITVLDARRTSQTAHVELTTTTFELKMGMLSLGRELGVDVREAVR